MSSVNLNTSIVPSLPTEGHPIPTPLPAAIIPGAFSIPKPQPTTNALARHTKIPPHSPTSPKHPRRERTQANKVAPTSPSKLRLKHLNIKGSPETQAAASRIPTASGVTMTPPRQLAAKISRACRKIITDLDSKEEKKRPAAIEKRSATMRVIGTLLDPKKGNTQVYAKGTAELTEHRRQMQSIKAIEDNTAADTSSLGGAFEAVMLHKTQAENRAQRYRRSKRIKNHKLKEALINQEMHFEAFARPDKPHHERVMTTEQVRNADPDDFF